MVEIFIYFNYLSIFFAVRIESFADSQIITQPFNVPGASGSELSPQVDRYLSKKCHSARSIHSCQQL